MRLLTSKVFQIIQCLYDATYVAMAVVVRVAEGGWVDLKPLSCHSQIRIRLAAETYLVYHAFLPPKSLGLNDVEFRHCAGDTAAIAKLMGLAGPTREAQLR